MQKKAISELKYEELTPVFEGIVIGPVIKFLRDIDESNIFKKQIDLKDLPKECKKIEKISQKLVLAEEKYIVENNLPSDIESISRSYILMIQEIAEKIIAEIKQNAINADYAVISVIANFSQRLQKLSDDYLRERIHDLQAIKNRFLAYLIEKNSTDIHTIKKLDKKAHYILVSDEIMPSDFSFIKNGNVAGIIHGKGGITSHIAIIARSLEIPTIVGAEKILSYIKDRDIVILDAYDGSVYINPEKGTLEEYHKKREQKQKDYLELVLKTKNKSAETLDKTYIQIMANIDVEGDIDKLSFYGADGIGLYRTEFLFLENEESRVSLSVFMDEEKQFLIYSQLAQKTNPNPAILRTLDISRNHIRDEKIEQNPFLGLRSTRYCLANYGILKTQLRAILRASHFGFVKIMIPMITNLQEIKTIKILLEEVKKELLAEGLFFDEDIELGVMIEVPSAALIIDQIAKEVDFITIRTGVLLQYILAVDKNSSDLAYLYNPFSLAFLRLLKNIVLQSALKPVYICGDIVADPLFMIFTLGVGFKGFSSSLYDIPKMKHLITQVSQQECKDLVDRVLEQNSDEEILALLKQFYNTNFALGIS